jgi:protein involved in polysaccharide export with SLBB domain
MVHEVEQMGQRHQSCPRSGRVLLVFLLALLLGACAISHPRLGPLAAVNAPAPPPEEPYRIQPGDELEIRFFHTPEQNVILPVRPDGFISLPLVYELRAAGRTVEEVRRELVERCASELAEPEVAVIVRSFTGYMVHVGGEVANPGVLQLSGPRTVLEAVFEAGGLLPTASPSDVLVVRRSEPTGYELLAANLDDVLYGRDGSGNFALRPFDVVFVPSTPIADVNKWVDQYIRKNLPINFTYRLDSGNNN